MSRVLVVAGQYLLPMCNSSITYILERQNSGLVFMMLVMGMVSLNGPTAATSVRLIGQTIPRILENIAYQEVLMTCHGGYVHALTNCLLFVKNHIHVSL